MKQDSVINSKFNEKESTQHKFEFPGSHLHEILKLPFIIEKMSLKIFPDFQNRILAECKQYLDITFLKETSDIELDIADIKILDVTSSSIKISDFNCTDNEKLKINLAEPAIEGQNANILIKYSAGYYERDGLWSINPPRSGFNFISKKNSKNESVEAYQAWTQGETTEARYWFPCIDSPHAKFSLDIEITAPSGFDVISNGVLVSKEDSERDKQTRWKYVEVHPLSAYLVSVVIGRFSKKEDAHNNIPLLYYWPGDIKVDDAMLTFSETPHMIRFFEDYFNVQYPFQKYAQVAVDNFEFGGMENQSCTTITRRVLHDKKTTQDYKNDVLLIVHELAHQWFGDLVTCKGWPHIWLNEGFATYCESLYMESSRGTDEFHYSLIESTDMYFEDANEYYVRPIVTKVYKHPDDLFDTHSYEKAGFILHMLRNFLGEKIFKRSLTQYLKKFQNLSVTSDDLISVIEDVSKIDIQTFFEQWIFRKGHPEIEIEYTLLSDVVTSKYEKVNKIKIKIIQLQGHHEKQGGAILPYQFSLEIKLKLQDTQDQRKEILHLMQVNDWDSESFIEFDLSYSISYISIDPNFKILKSIKSLKVQNESKDFELKKILLDQLKTGDTVIERIQSARILKERFDEDIINSLQDTILNDKFYGVCKEAANTIGSYQDNNNYEKSDKAFQGLISMVLEKETFKNLNNHVQRAIIKNIGLFERPDSVKILEAIINDSDIKSDFIKAAAATALGKSCKKGAINEDKKRIISLLKEIVNNSESFQGILAAGALEGLAELPSGDAKNIEIHLDVVGFLLENTYYAKDYFLRAKSTRLLGKFLLNKSGSSDPRISEMNQKVFCRLKELLQDERRKIKINACEALSDNEAKFLKSPEKITYESIQILMKIAKEDLDGFVRRKAETSANHIREWIHSWSSKPLIID